ncbi:MAG TPA: c-type cytochrome, partial [Vicinamibacterales bacterium]|nr:c-type cytochrome [Vicinamibacterales bacterium]
MMIRSAASLFVAVFLAQPAAAQQPASPAPPATIGSRFKNIQVLTDLKNAPAPQLFEMMQFMSGSLSVSCNYCHVSQNGPFESDDNTIKLKARDMIRLVRTINTTAFEGKQVVTCNTCHQGSPHPPAVPSPWHKSADAIAAYKADIASRKASSTAASPATVAPTAAEILARYRAAVRADRVTSIRVTGVNAIAMGGAALPFTAEAQFPERMRLMVDQGGPVETIISGTRGWRRTAQGTTDLIPGQVSSTRHTIELVMRPVKYDESVTDRKAAGTASIDGVPCYVVESRSDVATERLYFDVSTALLKMIRIDTPTPIGTRVEERRFSDYRQVNGVMIPHLMTSHYMEDQSEFRLATVEVNPAIDAKTFERPATDPFLGEWRLNPSKSTVLDQMKVDRMEGNTYAFDLGAGLVETIVVDGTD